MSEIVTVAERLIPLISELRQTTENDRCIAAPIVQAMRQSDLCRMLLDTGAPPSYTPEEWLGVLETLAGAEASVSWLIWNNTLSCFWVRFLDDAGRERVFGDPSRLFAGSTRPTGQAVPTGGGFRLSGRWSLVSGCELADYVHLMSLVHEDGVPRMRAPGQPDLRMLFVPKGATKSSTPGMSGAYVAPESRRRCGRRVRARCRLILARSPGGCQLTAGPASHCSRDDSGPWRPVPGHGTRCACRHYRDTAPQGVRRSGRIDSRATECARRHRFTQRCGRCRREPPPHQHGGSVGARQKRAADGRGSCGALQR